MRIIAEARTFDKSPVIIQRVLYTAYHNYIGFSCISITCQNKTYRTCLKMLTEKSAIYRYHFFQTFAIVLLESVHTLHKTEAAQ
jgi:hypothetical protein